MKKQFYAVLAGASLLVASVLGVHSAGLWPNFPQAGQPSYCGGQSVSGTTCEVTVPAGPALTGNELIPMDTQLANGAFPQTITATSAQVAGATWGSPRNFLG